MEISDDSNFWRVRYIKFLLKVATPSVRRLIDGASLISNPYRAYKQDSEDGQSTPIAIPRVRTQVVSNTDAKVGNERKNQGLLQHKIDTDNG